MNHNLRALRLFVRLAELESFTKVAEEFGLAKSVVSKELSRLEEDLGAKLLIRSTRKVRLSPLGEGYLSYCREALLKLEEADNFVSSNQQSCSGKLKVNAPMALGLTGFDAMVADFMAQYPQIQLDIELSDESLDLINVGADLALRIASRAFDSPYVGVPLATFSYRICVAKDYFDHHPPITKPEDLLQHNCFEYRYFRGKRRWPIGDGVTIDGNLKVNSTLFMKAAIKAGRGIGFLPQFVCAGELESGEFQAILEDFDRPQLTFYALYIDRRLVAPQVRLFIDALKSWYGNSGST